MSRSFILAISALVTWSCGRTAQRDRNIEELLRLKSLAYDIRIYQNEAGVSSCPEWDDLWASQPVTAKSERGFYRDPKTDREIPWWYLPEGRKAEAKGERFVMAAAALPVKMKRKWYRAVLWSDTSAQHIPEEEFQMRLRAAQATDMR